MSPRRKTPPTTVAFVAETDRRPAQVSLRPRFHILDTITSSAEHQLLLAHDEEVHRDVLLKTLPAGPAADAERQSRLLREARQTAALSHPGIVSVYGLGSDQSGARSYAMRLLRGATFAQAVAALDRTGHAHMTQDAWRAELRKLLRRFLDVCLALEFAHSRAIVHGGLEAGQVILGEYAETVVIDWSRVGADRPAVHRRHRPSPASRTNAPCPAADVRRLGVLLRQLLLGKPVPEGTVRLRRLNGWIPAALEAISPESPGPGPRGTLSFRACSDRRR